MNNPRLKVTRSPDIERQLAQGLGIARPPIEADPAPKPAKPRAKPQTAQPIVQPASTTIHIPGVPTLAEADAAIVAAQQAIADHEAQLVKLEAKLADATAKKASRRVNDLKTDIQLEKDDRPSLEDSLRRAEGVRVLALRVPEVAAWRQHVADLAAAREQVEVITQQLQKAVAQVKNLENMNYGFQSQNSQFYGRVKKLGLSDGAITEFYDKCNQHFDKQNKEKK